MGCDGLSKKTMEIGSRRVEDKLLLSEIVKNIEYIILDQKSSPVIYGVDKLIFENGKFFILDNSYSETLAVFTASGKHLFSLTIGLGGPNEFIEISDFDYFPESREIFVYSAAQRLIFVFDENGNPLRNYKIPNSFIVHSIGYLGENKFAFFRDMVEESKNDLKSQLFTYDFETNKVIDQAIPLSKNSIILAQDYALVRSGNQLFNSKVYGSEIYSISDQGEIVEAFKFSDVTSLTDRKDILDEESYRKVINEEKGILYLGNWIGNMDSHMFLIKKNQRPMLKWKSKTHDLLTKNIENDLGIPIFSGYKYLSDSIMIAFLDEEALGLLNSFPEGKLFLKSHKQAIDFLSPVIIKLKLKMP